MNLLKKWGPLVPGKTLDEIYSIEHIGRDLLVKMCNSESESEFVTIFFYNALHVRVTDESYVFGVINYENKDILNNSLFTVSNSEYIDFFIRASYGAFRAEELVHYFLFTRNECIDIITNTEPSVKKGKCKADEFY